MAWINRCVLFMWLISVEGYGMLHASALQRSERSAYHRSNVAEDGSVVFPGLTSRSGNPITLQIPDACKRIGICDNVPNYPSDYVSKLIDDLQRKNKTFNKDVLEPPMIAERIGTAEDNLELCASTEKLFIPESAQDEFKAWHVIINDKERPIQTFRVEICSEEHMAPCKFVANYQDGYTARCEQKYMLRNMLALDSDNNVIEKPFKVPSCCSCIAKTL